jgi:hypothetical protein
LKKSGAPIFCPVAIMLQCRTHSLSFPLLNRDSAFAVDTDGRRITAKAMASFIKAIVQSVTPDIMARDLALYTVHSFRVGALHHLLLSGVSVELAVDYLRWRSAAHMLYVRSSLVNFAKLPAGVVADFNADASYDSDLDDDASSDYDVRELSLLFLLGGERPILSVGGDVRPVLYISPNKCFPSAASPRLPHPV